MKTFKWSKFVYLSIMFIFLLSSLCQINIMGEEEKEKKQDNKKSQTKKNDTVSEQVLKRETLEKLPKGRDFLSIVPLVPGVNQESLLKGISINGASSSENRYFIDGVDTTTLYTGESGVRVNFDFIETIQVQAPGISAEYAGSTGGVIQVTTRSGSNEFHGALSLYYNGSALSGKPRPTLTVNPLDEGKAEYVTYPEDNWRQIEPGFSLGGRIIKDKLWFFGSFMPKFKTTKRDGSQWPIPGGTIFFGESHISGSNKFTRKDTYYAGMLKLTGQPFKNLRFSLHGTLDYYQWKGELPQQDGGGNPEREYSAIKFQYPNFIIGGSVDYTITNNLSLYSSVGYFRSNEKELYNPYGPVYIHLTTNADIPGIPEEFIVYPWLPYYSSIPYITTKNIQSRLTTSFDLSYSLKLVGQHHIKAGFQVVRIGIDKHAGMPYDYYRFYWNRNYLHSNGTIIPTTYGYVEARDPFGVVVDDLHSSRIAVYFQDNWTIGSKLTLNLGLRMEKEDIPAFAGGYMPPVQWALGDKLAPRIGFCYDVFGDAGLTVFGSFGVYYDVMKMALPEAYYGGFKWMSHYYDIGNWDWIHAFPETDHPQTSGFPGGRYLESRNWRELSFDTTQPGLKPFRKDEFTLGIRKTLAETWTLGARFLHNYIANAIEDVAILFLSGYKRYYIGNPGSQWLQDKFDESIAGGILPEGIRSVPAVRKYTAVTLHLDRKFKNNWLGGFSYTWSRLYGNYSGLASSDEPGRKAPGVSKYFDEWFLAYNQLGEEELGLLRTDRTHQFKCYGAYAFDVGLTLGFNAYAVSGVPIQTEIYLNSTHGFYPLGRASEGRTPWLWQIDLYAEYNLKLSDTFTLQFNLNIINLTDNDTAQTRYMSYNDGNVYLTDQQIKNGFNYAQLIAERGVHLDPRYNMAYDYLDAIAARLGVKLIF